MTHSFFCIALCKVCSLKRKSRSPLADTVMEITLPPTMTLATITKTVKSGLVMSLSFCTSPKTGKKRDGGILLDMEQNSKQYVPKFNSLISFAVPRKHAVTAVKPRKDRLPRYSLFGWFLVEGDLYKFKPEPLVEVRKPKRQKIQRKRKERR
mmetsp:Transcript_18335/g.36021  ORF Transcript_18335/g.36021 Transcript_18335/m.36021 type:complete len:152 (-) Transcript_18335:99-554(-)